MLKLLKSILFIYIFSFSTKQQAVTSHHLIKLLWLTYGKTVAHLQICRFCRSMEQHHRSFGAVFVSPDESKSSTESFSSVLFSTNQSLKELCDILHIFLFFPPSSNSNYPPMAPSLQIHVVLPFSTWLDFISNSSRVSKDTTVHVGEMWITPLPPFLFPLSPPVSFLTTTSSSCLLLPLF